MEKKKIGLSNGNQTSPKGRAYPTSDSIAQNKRKVKANPLKELRESKKLTARQIVETVNTLYPKYDRVLQSKCENDKYGVDLKPKAFDALLKKYAPELFEKEKHRRDGRHKYKCKVMCRLSDEEFAELKKRIKEDGFDTMQAWLAYKIRQYLKKEKNQ